MEAHGPIRLDMLTDLAAILSVAALTTVIFKRIKQPVVLGYLVAGLIVGPHVPVPVFADEALAHQMSDLGVVLLMFSLGLEFSLRKLIRVGPTAGLVSIIQCSLMIWLGYLVGRLFGWTGMESVFTGAVIAISSTTIIVKAFAEQGIKGELTQIVFGILIVEDLIGIVLLALLTPIASGSSLSPGTVAIALGKLGAFLAVTLVVGVLLVPRLFRYIIKTGSTETLVVASVGISFAFALLARHFGYSVALGSFLAGALVAESGQAKTVEHAIEPVRDVFAAVFFVSVGMLIDPGLVATHWAPVVVLTLVVVVGKVFGVTLGAFLAGHSVRTSVQSGMSLAQIGEFSFIIAGVGLSLGAIGSFLYPVAVAVSALTTLLTPFLIRISGRTASWLDHRLPGPLQTFVSLYGSWVDNITRTPRSRTIGARVRRLIFLLAIDMLLVAAVVIGTSLSTRRLGALVEARFGLEAGIARFALVMAGALVASPFILGAIRVARALGTLMAATALPADGQPGGGNGHDTGEARLDMAAAPRRALLVTLQLCMLLAAGIPLVAITQPFLPSSVPGAIFLLVGLALLVLPFWRSATDLHGHARAGAQVILEALARQSHTTSSGGAGAGGAGGASAGGNGHGGDGHGADPGAAARRMLPGLGEAATVLLPAEGPAVGKTLEQLDLRGLTGATVIAVEREAGILYPGARDPLHAGDVLVLTGTDEAVSAARDLLVGAGATATEPITTTR